MKIAILIARILLGLTFFAAGLLGIVHPMAPPPNFPPDAATFATILTTHGYMTFVDLLMVISGLLLLVGRFVPIALVILGPILVNILLFHFTLQHAGAVPGIIATVLEIFLIWAYRFSFGGLFNAAPKVY